MRTGLRIRVLEGRTVDGRTEFEFPATGGAPEQRIVIGRDPDHCQIVFVEDLRLKGLGNEHLTLRRSNARYQLDLNTDNRVLLNGRATFEDKELRGTNVLQLGDGVKIEVTVVDDRTATVGATPGAQPHEVALKNRRLLAALAAVVAALAVGAFFLIPKIPEPVPPAPPAVVPSDVMERTAESVYLIVKKSESLGGETACGTGWSAPGGVIVTNAHIAEDIDAADDDLRWFARSAVPPYKDYEIVSAARIHPGYSAFAGLASDQPMQETIEAYETIETVGACDVAVLGVKLDEGESLAEPLPIASREELNALRAGDAVALIGFSMEGLDPLRTKEPVPLRHRGGVVRLTDFFMHQRDDGVNQLVQHDVPVAGGSSGSPIVDTKGRVIAVHSGANTIGVTDRGRILGQVVNYGQRADFVLDLLENDESQRLVEYRRMWEESLANVQRASDIIVANEAKTIAAILGKPKVDPLVEEFRGQAGHATTMEELAAIDPVELHLPAGVFSLVVVPDDAERPVDLDIGLFDAEGRWVDRDTSTSAASFIRLVNPRPQTYVLKGWYTGDVPTFHYTVSVHDWQSDPERYTVGWVTAMIGRRLERELSNPPPFAEDVGAVALHGRPGSNAGCRLTTKIPAPGLYVAIGRVTAPVPISMELVAGGKQIEATTSRDDAGNVEGDQLPIVLFEVTEPDAEPRFACHAAPIDTAEGLVEVGARIIGWPGVEMPVEREPE